MFVRLRRILLGRRSYLRSPTRRQARAPARCSPRAARPRL